MSGLVTTDLVTESNAQFAAAWQLMAARAAGGVTRPLPGLAVAWSQVSLPLLNALFVDSPVADPRDLAQRVERARAHAAGRGVHGLLFLCRDWLPRELPGGVEGLLGERGLALAMTSTGMVAERLAPPRRRLPPLVFRPVEDALTRRAVAHINCVSYGLPLVWGEEALDREDFWREPVFGYVGYWGGEAVTTGVVLGVDGRLYVGLVATLPEYRRRGCAEAVMRHGLEEAGRRLGITRSVLHATPMGLPLYREMGYRATAEFLAFQFG
jgi:ribosomal protein S18 acetylase RimI-like enzyme